MEKLALVQPTAITLAERASRALGREVWVKHDNATHPRYGGNKVRKLEHLLAEARAEGATDVITAGAAGSHHVLATAVHGGAAGFSVEAVITPRPRAEHAVVTLRATLAQGATLHPAANPAEALVQVLSRVTVLRAQGRSPFVIRPGGSSPRGALAYVEAMAEAAEQLRTLGIAPVDAMVVPLGSGGTLAGMMAGARLHRVETKLVGVRVAGAWMSPRPAIATLAEGALALAAPGDDVPKSFRRSEVNAVEDQVGEGYGHPTDAAREALALLAEDGVALDLTYTAKAAAGLIALARKSPPGTRYLFWNTLSSAPLGGLMQDTATPIPEHLDALLR